MLKNPTPNGNYRPVYGHPGYLIDDKGIVWSRHRRGSNGKRKFYRFWSKKLKQFRRKDGYLTVILSSKNGLIVRRVHQLVLLSFGFRRPSRNHVTRHLNGDPTDNRLSNLKWGTHQENMDDMVRHGRVWRGGSKKKG